MASVGPHLVAFLDSGKAKMELHTYEVIFTAEAS